ncbi:ABC transporter substrate-binding protein [Corynebacterium sp. A21]|uniref:ABC transporter substrate-binding protein n=1 Tax=Corynebacterium sp. A21 TaxID=3457318 RepID=UPI003FCFDBAA
MKHGTIQATVVAVTAMLLSACGTTTPVAATGEQIDNCGVPLDISQQVQRAVTTEQGATDTLLALGQSANMAGTSHLKDAVLPAHQREFESIPVLSDSIATAEQIRNADADFIYAPFASVFTADQSGTRQEWADLGVRTFLTNTQCPDHADNAGKSYFELLEKDFQQLGVLFDAEDNAAELIDHQRQTVAAAGEIEAGKTVAFLYSVYEGAPYIAGGSGIAQEMSELLGLENVFADVPEEWPEISWEAIAEADPDYLVLADLPGRGAPGDPYQDKIEMMREHPAMSHTRAVMAENYLVVPGVGLAPSARSSEPLEILTEALQ